MPVFFAPQILIANKISARRFTFGTGLSRYPLPNIFNEFFNNLPMQNSNCMKILQTAKRQSIMSQNTHVLK
jgi:hypothetical protein